jgi:hypothetical protein
MVRTLNSTTLRKVPHILCSALDESNIYNLNVLMAVAMKITIFWVVALCNSKRSRLLGGTHRLHLAESNSKPEGRSLERNSLPKHDIYCDV